MAVGEEDMVVEVVVAGITGYKEVCFVYDRSYYIFLEHDCLIISY